ncbi:MAG: dephospho-CoA kinase, partial [Gammaproteobacteria bacterium]|nr:dephospho-CoA kinase [Gammaproteobacteria bacterium]
HPRIEAAMLGRSARAAGPYQVLVVPLLIESGFTRHVDRILVVDCPDEVQRQRLRQRDAGSSAAAVDGVLAAQLSREERLRHAHDVITNAGSVDDTRAQVGELHRRYLALAAARVGD